MKVTARRSVEFPKLEWAISAGETKELPESKEAEARILQHPAIIPMKAAAKKEKPAAPVK